MSVTTGHLSEIEIESLVDREMDEAQSALAESHLATCQECARRVLAATQLKQAVREGAVRYQPSPAFQRRMMQSHARERSDRTGPVWWLPWILPLAASLLIVALLGTALVFGTNRISRRDALAAEVLDQHIAMLAGGAAPEVLSSDKHTVRPWFQGKLPFAFNLPDALPADTTLEGANVTYVQGEPAAELLFRIRKHRASVFVTARRPGMWLTSGGFSRSGFHLAVRETGTLRLVGVTDADAAALEGLMRVIAAAQK
ncbi:MAG: anti-sigma factor family protein [Acidobacteriaceae bacterium]